MRRQSEASQANSSNATFSQHLAVGRPPKASPQETVEYEINMLRFAHTQINRDAQNNDVATRRAWMTIECFLLHYRNLIQLLSVSDKRGDDLSMQEDFGEQVNEATRVEIERIVTPLLEKYSGQISKYLAHCTRLRHELDRYWSVNEMYVELLPAIRLVRSSFGRVPWADN